MKGKGRGGKGLGFGWVWEWDTNAKRSRNIYCPINGTLYKPLKNQGKMLQIVTKSYDNRPLSYDFNIM